MSRRLRTFSTLCSLLAVLAVASVGHAQSNQILVTPNYRDADVRMVAEQLQELLGRPILVDPAVSARITLLSGQPITPDAFYGLFKSALEVHGLVALDAGNAIQIVPDPNARVRQTR